MEFMRNIKSRLTDEPVKGREWIYIRQSFYAAIYIGLVFWVMEYLEGIPLFPCLAATAFIVFTLPQSKASSPRQIIGGYIIAGIVGVAFGILGQYLIEYDVLPFRPDIILSIITVFLVVLMMSILDLGHPPAAAMAATLTLMSTPIPTAITAVVSVIVLCIFKQAFKRRLYDL